MSRTVERIEESRKNSIRKNLERLQKTYETNRSHYAETGHNYYLHRMEQIQEEIEELEAYRDKWEDILYRELELEELKAQYQSNLEMMKGVDDVQADYDEVY
jgi:hypothetical protein